MALEVPKLAYSVKEAVHATSLQKSTIYNLINAGKLESRRVGGRTVIMADSLRRLLGEAA